MTTRYLILAVAALTACAAGGPNGSHSYHLVFLVDDSPTSMLAAEARIASMSAVAVRTFRTGTEAVSAMDRDRPDVVVTDLYLGDGVGGIGVCIKAKRHRIPCIVITSGDVNPAELRAAGVRRWLQKRDLDSLPGAVLDAIGSVAP